MGIVGRMQTLLKANINHIVAKSEDPELILNQLVQEMREQLVHAKLEVKSAIADEKLAHRAIGEHQEQLDLWQKRAEMAAQAGRDDMAREALRQRGLCQDRLTASEQAWAQHKQASQKARASLIALDKKVRQAEAKRTALITKHTQIKLGQAASQQASSMGGLPALERMASIEQRLEQEQIEFEARREVDDAAPTTPGRSAADMELEMTFGKLEAQSEDEGDRALRALKERMGMS